MPGRCRTLAPCRCHRYARAVPKTVREIEKILRANGWGLVRMVGSHRQYAHPDNPNVVTVPGAPGKQVATGTLSSIRRASGIEELR